MSNTRVIRNTSSGIVAGIAGYASYWHQVELALVAGERVELAHILPGSVDGLLVVASIAMVDARQEGRKPSWQVKLGFALGIAASVGANVMSAHPTILGRIVAAWPAVALLLVVEMLASRGRKLPADEMPEPAATSVAVVEPAAPVAAPAQPATEMAELESPDLPEAPQSPAVAPAAPRQRGPRGDYGPRNGDEYAPRTQSRKRTGK